MRGVRSAATLASGPRAVQGAWSAGLRPATLDAAAVPCPGLGTPALAGADGRIGRSTVGCACVRRPRHASAAGRRSMRGVRSAATLASGPRAVQGAWSAGLRPATLDAAAVPRPGLGTPALAGADGRIGRSTVGCACVCRPRHASAAGRRSMRGVRSAATLASGPRAVQGAWSAGLRPATLDAAAVPRPGVPGTGWTKVRCGPDRPPAPRFTRPAARPTASASSAHRRPRAESVPRSSSPSGPRSPGAAGTR